jgi:hypothetical protein
MNVISLLAAVSAVVLVLHVAACIPAALAELLRACAPVFDAWTVLRHPRNETDVRKKPVCGTGRCQEHHRKLLVSYLTGALGRGTLRIRGCRKTGWTAVTQDHMCAELLDRYSRGRRPEGSGRNSRTQEGRRA